MLTDYCREKGYRIVDCYVDDGETGTNFERPEFQRMLRDIEAGKINTVICKDLSRFGRNYYETGMYLDKYFVERKIRLAILMRMPLSEIRFPFSYCDIAETPTPISNARSSRDCPYALRRLLIFLPTLLYLPVFSSTLSPPSYNDHLLYTRNAAMAIFRKNDAATEMLCIFICDIYWTVKLLFW